MKKYLSFDVGGTDLKFGIITEEGDIIFKEKIPAPKKKEEFFEKIRVITENCKSEFLIEGVAMSMPGIIDTEKGYTVSAGAMRELYNCNLRDELEKVTGLRVSLENDTNCIALAEKWLGNGRDKKNFVCIGLGTGIGGAVVINGSLYRGSKYMAGEFGFTLIGFTERGNSGLIPLSSVASTQKGIVEAYSGLSGKKLKGEEISELYIEGDFYAKVVFDEFFKCIAGLIYNLIFIVDPEKILIGGAISKNYLVIEGIKDRLETINKKYKRVKLPEVEACKFYNDSGIIGAVYNFISLEEKR